MHENAIATKVLDAAFIVHSELGSGLLESVYESAMEWELTQAGLFVQRQLPIHVRYKEAKLELGFRADLVIERTVIIEVKAVEAVPAVAYRVL